MPRRRPPIEIYACPVPAEMVGVSAECPACAGPSEPIGYVVQRLLFKCRECGIRFKHVYDPDRGGN